MINKQSKKLLAFTLAEVLITLGIIGIVATTTIPIIKKYNDRATVSAVKKAYSVLYSAFSQAVGEEGTPDNWGASDARTDYSQEDENGVNSKILLDKMLPYLRVSKNCGTTNNNCFTTSMKALNGASAMYSNWKVFAYASLEDGSSLAFSVMYTTSTYNPYVWGQFYYDINGLKGPNKVGVDIFMFWMLKDKILPLGTKGDPAGYTPTNFTSYCQRGTGSGFSPDGKTCTAWVLYNENTDYLNCDGLSWSGPITCK